MFYFILCNDTTLHNSVM